MCLSDILPHPGGGQLADPLNVHSWDNGKLDPEGLFKAPPGPSAAATLAQNEANPLLKAAESGTLTDAQKATVTQAVQGERAQGNQLLASAGLGRSSSQVSVENAALATGTQLTNDFLNQDYQEALSLLGVSNQGLVDAANIAIQQDEAMGQAFGQAAQSFAMIYGNYEPNAPQPQTEDLPQITTPSMLPDNWSQPIPSVGGGT